MAEDGDLGSGSSGGSDGDVSLESIPLHSSNLLTVVDESGVVRYESPSIERVFGFGQMELVGDGIGGYVHPDDRDGVVDAFFSLVDSDGGGVEAVEYRHLESDGSYCWVESVASSNPTPEGFYVVNTRDISEQRERERKLRETNRRLDEFARVLSHDLRNPLQVARGRLDLARDDRDSEHLAAVDRAHARMEGLIEDILAVARDNESVDETDAVDLRSVVVEGWRNVETEDATLDPPSEGVVSADMSRLQQLVENLFRNAVEHGGSDVSVTVGVLEDGFYVEDDGDGIPEVERERVFEPGFSSSEDGVGFGLGIVERVAEAHGWEVDVGGSAGARFEVSGVEFG